MQSTCRNWTAHFCEHLLSNRTHIHSVDFKHQWTAHATELLTVTAGSGCCAERLNHNSRAFTDLQRTSAKFCKSLVGYMPSGPDEGPCKSRDELMDGWSSELSCQAAHPFFRIREPGTLDPLKFRDRSAGKSKPRSVQRSTPPNYSLGTAHGAPECVGSVLRSLPMSASCGASWRS